MSDEALARFKASNEGLTRLGYCKREPEFWRQAVLDAIDSGVLSFDGGYAVMGCGMNLNPKPFLPPPTYFATVEAVKWWRAARYKGALYTVDILKVEKV